jgi:hypothetical protein
MPRPFWRQGLLTTLPDFRGWTKPLPQHISATVRFVMATKPWIKTSLFWETAMQRVTREHDMAKEPQKVAELFHRAGGDRGQSGS